MTDIQQLDYSRPPPGYLVHDLNDDGWWWRVDEPEDGCLSPYETEVEALAAAWAHYKASNDPPGCSELFCCAGLDADGEQIRGWKFRFGIASDEVLYAAALLSRTAAWDWYDRRADEVHL